MKRIITFISGIIMMLGLIVLMPVDTVKAGTMAITGVNISESSVDVSTNIQTITVNVGVSVTGTELVSSINVRLECMNGGSATLYGTAAPSAGTGIYSVSVTVPTSAYGRYVVMEVTAGGSEGGSAHQASYVGLDSVIVRNDNVLGYNSSVRPLVTSDADADWVNIGGAKYLRVRIGEFEEDYVGNVRTIVATFKNENGDKLEVSNFYRSTNGYFFALVKATDIKKEGTYNLEELNVHDSLGNEALYNCVDKYVIFNGNVGRTYPLRLDSVSFVVGSSNSQTTTVATNNNSDNSELKSPGTGEGNSVGVAVFVIVALVSAMAGFVVVIAKKNKFTV